MNRAQAAAKLGTTALKIYTCHLLVFAMGGLLVGLETVFIMAPAASPSYTVGLITGLTAATIIFSAAKIIDFVRSVVSK